MNKKKIKMNSVENEDVKLIKRLIIILVSVVIVVICFYYLTDKLVKPTTNNNNVTTNIDYDVATVGTMFNRPYSNYFVLLYDSTKSEAAFYNTILDNYRSASDNKVYYVDFSLKENSKYVKSEANKNVSGPSDASFTGPTLIEIKNGKVVSYYDTKEEIKNILK